MSLRDELTAPAGTWTDEIEVLLRRMPDRVADEWEVYDWLYEGRPSQSTTDDDYENVSRFDYPSQSVQLAYLPDSVQPTQWIALTNQIDVRHRGGYPLTLDIDADGDREKPEDDTFYNSGQERKYIVTGTFVDPFVTRSADRVVERLEVEMDRVMEATEVNAEIERLTDPDQWMTSPDSESSDDPADYTEQSSPVSIPNFAEGSVKRLATKAGAYYNTTLNRRWGLHRDPRDVLENIEKSVERYERFRQRDDWGRVDIPPDTWTDYPKEDHL